MIYIKNIATLFKYFALCAGADPGFGNGGGGGYICWEASYIYELSEYKSAGGIWGIASLPRYFLNLEPLRVNLSVI